ncbi:MAG: iron ABC transporter permease [Deltaproteobacteria bacterium]|nr:iron ABC transporter permease [Deltaproteobacteria bacterium]MBI2229614.1 iron ABC transporter permease [Deltaproteobacteria bacterium]MBI2532057.1 iron ABC transporter permease [Deltaproteobacteria bacterium]MBI3063811.1 iron ABC transporter permease [Deltaproteobacteria bacterium]
MTASSFDRRYLLMAAAGVFVLLVVVYPLWQVLFRSFLDAGVLSLKSYQKVFSYPSYYRALLNSVWISCATAALCMVLGTLLAFLVVRTDLPGKTSLRTLLVLPYALPSFFAAIAWIQLLGPQGYLARLLLQVFGSAAVPWNLYSAGGIVFVLTVHYFILVFITVAGALERMDASLEEAARASGAGTYRIMREITLPLVLPAIVAGGLLAFIGALANFGIPALLGMRARFFVLTTSVYYALAIPDFGLATALSSMLVLVALISMALQFGIQKGESRYTVISGKAVHPAELKLGASRYPLFLFTVALVVCISIIPVLSMVLTALMKYWGAPLTAANLTLQNFTYVLKLETAQRAVTNSLFLGAVAATAAMFVGTLISYLHVKAKLKGSRVLDFLATIPYAVPHTVIAIAMILAWAKPPVSLYGTLWIILVAYLAVYLPFAVRTTNSTLQQVHDSLEEAARASGAKIFPRLRDIVLPLARPGMIAGWILVFMPALRELTVSILLYAHHTETIGVVVYNLQDAGYREIAAALAALVMALLIAGNMVIRKLTGGVAGF